MVQAKVEDVVANKASESGANLVDPNTGQEVQVPSGDSSKPKSSKPKSSKAASKAKERNPGQLVDPNTGNKVEASATVESKPATKPSSSSKSKKEQSGEDRAGPSTSSGKVEPSSEKDQPVSINRAPVLTLWVAVVAERQGFSKEAGMTFGKAISGMLAQSKGRYDLCSLAQIAPQQHVLQPLSRQSWLYNTSLNVHLLTITTAAPRTSHDTYCCYESVLDGAYWNSTLTCHACCPDC